MTRKPEKLKFLAPAFVMALIFTLSHQPNIPHSDIVPYYDKFLHIVAYAVLGATWVFALKNGSEDRRRERRILTAAFVSTLLFGISDEYHQLYIPGRTCEFADIVADGIGALLGAWVWTKMKPMKKGGTKPP